MTSAKRGMKVLLLDIETSLHKVYTFSLYKPVITPKQIIEPTKVLCWATKWLGEKKVHFSDCRDGGYIKRIHAMIDEADAIIHYNGKAFDMKHLNREFLLRKMPPPSPYWNIDLLTVVRGNFKMASNKLGWVTLELGYEGKVQHRGIQLWIDCQEHNYAKAWKEMKRYNIRDVTEMEPVYYDLLPWIKQHPNWGLYVDSDRPVCRNCGSKKIVKCGIERTKTLTYQRYRCKDCHSSIRGRKRLDPAPDGLTV